MATTLSAILRAAVVASLDSGAAVNNGVTTLAAEPDIALINGTGTNSADLLYAEALTVSASSSTTLVLSDSTMKSRFGGSLPFVKVKVILIKASSANTNNVVYGNAASHPFVGPCDAGTDTISVSPGGFLFLAHPVSGWAVGSGTADQIKLANSSSGTSVTFDVVIIGTSA